MSKDLYSIKGGRDGLMITIKDGKEFPRAIAALERQLSSAQSFFAGASAKLYVEKDSLDPQQIDHLEELMARYEMKLDRKPPRVMESMVSEEAEPEIYGETPEENTLLVRRTIRSGQRVYYNGNVVVMGDVNPGAEIICSGDILVLGSLRGVAHAGAEGKVDATVYAFRLEPTQLRIAHYISRAPDGEVPQPSGPEIARVVENLIQVSNYNH